MNVGYTTKHHLCLGCGLCEDVCPANSISIGIEYGEYRPKIAEDSCLGDKCSRCSKICPGLGVSLKKYSRNKSEVSELKENKYIGQYVNLYTGHSTDEDIRYHSASGGLVTGLLIYLIEKKIIAGAVVTRFSSKDNITPETFIARTKEELISARSSKYCPVSMQGIRKQIREAEGKYIIVGLPCHLHGFRKIEEIDKKFREHIFAYWGIYCSSGRTFRLTDYVFSRRNLPKEAVSYFAYRDEGCLGSMVVKYSSDTNNVIGGDSSQDSPFALKNVYKESFGSYYCTLRSFFIPRRCQFCIDHFAELSDMSFGDLHIKPYSEDKIGTSSIVARTEEMNNLLMKAQIDGVIKISDLPIDVLNASQQMAKVKKHKYGSFVKLLHKVGMVVPEYDVEYSNSSLVKTVIAYISICSQRFVGRHQHLWWIVDILKQKYGKTQ